jgi:hypothetical protein
LADGSVPIEAFVWICGVLVSVAAVIVFSATFIPPGSCAFNPHDEDDDRDEAEVRAHSKEAKEEGALPGDVEDEMRNDADMLEAAFG